MKITFLIPRLTYSGAPKMLAWVANRMQEKGHSVEIVAFFSDEVAQPLNQDVRFHYLNVRQSGNRVVRNTLGMMKTISALHRHIRETAPDVIVSFLDSVGYIYLSVNRLFGRRKIVVSERVDPHQYHGFLSKVRFMMMKFADGYVFQTEGAKNFFRGRIADRGVVIPNPVTVRRSAEIVPCRYVQRDERIVTVGRLSLKQKRQDVLLEAFAIVRQVHPEMRLEIYGDGKDQAKIQEMIDSMGLGDAVRLAGRTNNVERDIHSARAFVLTSDFEGIPNALIEAMSVGVPSVATDCSPGGAALLIEDGVNAYLTGRGNAQMIAERLNELIENEGTADRFTANAPAICERFSEEAIADKWDKYFAQISQEE